jgi:hypothetical protein
MPLSSRPFTPLQPAELQKLPTRFVIQHCPHIDINGILWFDQQPPNNLPCIVEDEDGSLHSQYSSPPPSANGDCEDLSSKTSPCEIREVVTAPSQDDLASAISHHQSDNGICQPVNDAATDDISSNSAHCTHDITRNSSTGIYRSLYPSPLD